MDNYASTTTFMQNNKITMNYIATTFFGLENVLAEELTALGAENVEKLNRAVSFNGDKLMLYKANYNLRTALKILVPIFSFNATDNDIFYRRVKKIEWQKFIDVKNTFAIDCVASGDVFTHSKYMALKTKDAICDYFREKKGIRPNVDVETPDLRVNVHIYGNKVDISLDSTGVPMSRRGYRRSHTIAPINEVLAAGLLKISGWDTQKTLIDPMCGSGTIAIEAALMALNIAPGSFRNFAFEKWKDFDVELFKKMKHDCYNAINRGKKINILAFDIDPAALDIASNNARNAGVEKMIEFDRKDFFANDNNFRNCLLITNPPYGERLEDPEKIADFYKRIGDRLKKSYTDCQAWIICGNAKAAKSVGLRASKKTTLYNGPIECKFMRFDMY